MQLLQLQELLLDLDVVELTLTYRILDLGVLLFEIKDQLVDYVLVLLPKGGPHINHLLHVVLQHLDLLFVEVDHSDEVLLSLCQLVE